MQINVISGVKSTVAVLAGKIQARMQRRMMVSLKPEQRAIGNVLISYIVEPFLLKVDESLPVSHTHYWECLQIAKTFLEMGYCVDVIRCDNDVFIPQKDYVFFIETRWNLQRSTPHLNKDCIKIFHADTAHLLFHNAAEANRLLALQQRRGITLKPRRYEPPNQAIEHADCAIVLGNKFTLNTYKYAQKPLYPIPITTPVVYPWPENKNFDACRKHFVWFSSGGLVHKGLDLLLDVFSQMSDYHLTICGPVDKEEDFVQAFYKELYQTPNIHTVGWIDITSHRFREITNSCIGLVYPSCSEGQSGAVVTCLHAGLIPILSYESGVDVHNFGVILQECSITEIKEAIIRISCLSIAQLKLMAQQSWEYARAHHTKEKFRTTYLQTINTIQENHNIETTLPVLNTRLIHKN
ncbi:glycosyltransferase [Chlorogloeopsis sp. ULAP02]|uniref:glycosyltransferase n=1 Tax=Chlorogloeopsis sp. ULAP02 TaxID=3107926 RepID=UPI00313490E4